MENKQILQFGDVDPVLLAESEQIEINIADNEIATSNEDEENISKPVQGKEVATYEVEHIKKVVKDDPIMNVRQAAEYLCYRQETILRKIYSGELKASKLGRVWRLRQSELDDYMARNETK